MLKHNAKVDLTDDVGKNAYSAALYSDRYELLDFLLNNGLKVDSDKGKSFRQAVFNQQISPAIAPHVYGQTTKATSTST